MWHVPLLVLQVMVIQGQKEKPDDVFHHFLKLKILTVVLMSASDNYCWHD